MFYSKVENLNWGINNISTIGFNLGLMLNYIF